MRSCVPRNGAATIGTISLRRHASKSLVRSVNGIGKNVSCLGFKTEHDLAKSKPELNLGARSNLFDFYVMSISHLPYTFYSLISNVIFHLNVSIDILNFSRTVFAIV